MSGERVTAASQLLTLFVGAPISFEVRNRSASGNAASPIAINSGKSGFVSVCFGMNTSNPANSLLQQHWVSRVGFFLRDGSRLFRAVVDDAAGFALAAFDAAGIEHRHLGR